MGFAEDKMWEYVKKHLDGIQALPLVDLLDHLSGCLTQPEIEALRASLRNVGASRTAFDFVDSLRRRSDWVNAFINALRRCDRPDIADHYQELYDRCQLPKPSQKSNIPPPHSTSLPSKIEAHAACFQNPAYSRDPASPAAPVTLSGATSSESQPQSQPLPSQQALNSSTTAGAVTQSHEDTETQTPKQESHPAGGVLTTNLTFSSNTAAVVFQLDPSLSDAVSHPEPQDTKKGDFESRLSQEETHAIEMPTTDGPSSFTPFHLGPGNIAYVPSTDRVVRRKELARGNGDQDEPLASPIWKFQPAPREELARDARKTFNREDELREGNEGAAAHPVTRKVNETTTQQLHPNPPPAPSNVRNAPGVVPKSQIPRKHPQSRDVPDTTTSPAIKGTPVRPVQLPTRIPSTRPSTNTGVHLRMDTRDSEEEEADQACSKPGVLTSVQPTNPAIHPPASPEESQRSSMRSSRLAISQSSDNTPCNESTLNRQHNKAHPGSRSDKNLDYRQGQGPSKESSKISSFSVRSDPIMIGGSSTGSMPPEVREAEEVDYEEGSPARERSTDEECGDYRNDNSAANRVSLLRNVPGEFDDANSMENTRHYEIHYSHNPSIPNYDPRNPVNSPNNILPSGTNSQGKGDNEKKKNNVPVYQIVLAAIAFALIGVLLQYKYKQT